MKEKKISAKFKRSITRLVNSCCRFEKNKQKFVFGNCSLLALSGALGVSAYFLKKNFKLKCSGSTLEEINKVILTLAPRSVYHDNGEKKWLIALVTDPKYTDISGVAIFEDHTSHFRKGVIIDTFLYYRKYRSVGVPYGWWEIILD